MVKGIIVPSIASANQLNLQHEIEYVLREGAEELHFDIEDGNFIPNITFGIKTLRAIREITKVNIHVHLLVTNPLDYLEDLSKLKPVSLTFQIESTLYPLEIVNKYKDKGVPSGVAFQPSTSVESFSYVLETVDNCLVMMCEPDGRGQQYLSEMEKKVEYITKVFPKTELWVDGGVNISKACKLLEFGKDLKIVMGRAVFSSDVTLREMQEKLFIENHP